MRALVFALLLAGCAHSLPAPDFSAITAISDASADPKKEPAERFELEWQLAQALERAGLFHLTTVYLMPLVRNPEHPHRREAIQALLRLHEGGRDHLLIPAVLQQVGEVSGLTELEGARLAWLQAFNAYRRGELEQTLELCARVAPASPLFERAQYLRALALSDPRQAGAARVKEAIGVLEQIAPQARDMEALVLLALGRLTYREQRWADARRWYDEAAKLESIRPQALVEQAWVFIQLGDWKAALSNVTRGEVWNAGRSEAPMLEALALHYSGRPADAEAVIQRIQSSPALKHDWRTEEDESLALEALTSRRLVSADEQTQLRRNVRLARLVSMLDTLDAELNVINQVAEWKRLGLHATFSRYLAMHRRPIKITAEHYALMELRELQLLTAFDRDVAELVGVEVALSRRDVPLAIRRLESVASKLPKTMPGTSDLWFRVAALQQAKAPSAQRA